METNNQRERWDCFLQGDTTEQIDGNLRAGPPGTPQLIKPATFDGSQL
jgi:hypothetical protein